MPWDYSSFNLRGGDIFPITDQKSKLLGSSFTANQRRGPETSTEEKPVSSTPGNPEQSQV
jgi:hypothetical protein